MRSERFGRIIVILAAVGVALCGWMSPALAVTWTGTTDNDWGDNANWGGNPYPSATDDVATIAIKNAKPDLDVNASIGTLQIKHANTGVTSAAAKTLTFDVTAGQAKIIFTRTGDGVSIGSDVILNDQLLIGVENSAADGFGKITFSGKLTAASGKDIYVAAESGLGDRGLSLNGDLSAFNADIYLQPSTGSGNAALVCSSLGVGELTNTTIYMGQDSAIDAHRSSAVVEADIVLQGDAKFMSNGDKGGFKTTGIISGSGDLSIDRANGGPTLEIGGSAPNTFTGDVDIFKHNNGGRVLLSKDGAMGQAPTLSIGDDIELYITSSGGLEDRIWDSTVVNIEGNTDDAIYGRFNLASGVLETVDQLWIDGLQIAAGTYNSASLETLNHISGAGELVVLSGPGGVIPEPSTFAIWALGLLALGWYARRRRR